MAIPSKKSRRGQLHLWFEFLRLAHRLPEFSVNLREVSPHYAAWGDVTKGDFTSWWSKHHHLFGETEVRSVREIIPCPGVVHLAVPTDVSMSELKRQFAKIIQREKNAIETDYIEPGNLSTFHFEPRAFTLTKGSQPREKNLWETLLITTVWIDFGQPVVNDRLCFEVLRYAESARFDVPYVLRERPQPDRRGKLKFSDNQIRQVLKHQKRGYEICRSVSLGRFPGKSRLK